MQGIPAGFALTALANYLAAEQVSTGEIGAFIALIGFPWGIKFIWGPIVDRYTHRPMGHRKPWIILSQLLALLSLVAILMVDDITTDFKWLSILFCFHAIFASIQDVAVDALAIEIVPEDERGKTTAFMRSGMVVGTAIGAAGLGYILRIYGFEWAALLEILLLGGLTLASFFIREHRKDFLFPKYKNSIKSKKNKVKSSNFRFLFRELFKGITQRTSLLLTLAISIVYLTESLYRRVLDVFLIQNEGWTDIELSSLKGIPGTLLTLAIIFVGGWLVDRYGGRRILMTTLIILLALYIGYSNLESYWGDQWFTSSYLLIKGTTDALVNVAAIPLFMYLARPGVEGSQFVFYMALSNQMDVLGASMAGLATKYMSVTGLGWFCTFAILFAILLVNLSMRQGRQNGYE